MDDNELKNEKSMRDFLTKKYVIELVYMIIMLAAIGLARSFSFIDNATTAAMGGLVIGYFAQDIRKLHS